MRLVRRIAQAAMVAGLLVPQPGAAGSPGAWRMECGTAERCQIVASQHKGGRLVTRLMLYEVGGRLVLEYLVPLGVDLQKGVSVQIGTASWPTQALHCTAEGCAGFMVADPALAALTEGTALKLVFSPRNGSRSYAYVYRLDGFAVAHGAFRAARLGGMRGSAAAF